jgi:hypothetical protein
VEDGYISGASLQSAHVYLLAGRKKYNSGLFRGFYQLSGTRWVIAFVVMFLNKAQCQDEVRMSLASEQAAEAQHPNTTSNYYNIQTGPVYFRFEGEMGLELNDNANYSETSPDADVALRPTLNVEASWPVTEQNTLALSAGVGYVEYLRDRSLSHLNITSDSGLDFKVYSGDFVLDFHDRFSAVDYEEEDPSVSASFIRLENTIGVSGDWDLNRLILSLGYDHDMFNSLSGNFQYSDNNSELFFGRAAFLVGPRNRVGLEAGGGWTTFDEHILDDSTHFSVGPYYQAQLTPHINTEFHAGFATYQFSHDATFSAPEVAYIGATTNVSDFNGYYAALSINHVVNDRFSHSLMAGRRIQEGITANLSDVYYAGYKATWHVLQSVSTTAGFEYDHGNTSGGVVETYDYYGPTIGFRYQITDKLGNTVTYNFIKKDSDVSTLSYTQNRILIDFTYAF